MSKNTGKRFEELVELMHRLRGEGGCPWDREQTRESLKPFLIEEAYEVLEALDEGDLEKYKEELGDLLLQAVFHAQIAREQREFTIEDVLRTLVEKLVRRHPHVFGEAKASSAHEVLHNWELMKRDERREKEGKASALEGVPKELPALLRAQRLQDKAARVGFDWKHIEEVWGKVEEEFGELREAVQERPERVEAEFGDLLFALVNLSRFLEVNAEEALRKSIARFIARFRYIEEEMARRGKALEKASLDEMDALWEEAKAYEQQSPGVRGQGSNVKASPVDSWTSAP